MNQASLNSLDLSFLISLIIEANIDESGLKPYYNSFIIAIVISYLNYFILVQRIFLTIYSLLEV